MSFAVTTNELSELDAPILIDVREQDEYISGHVPGAINIPLSELVGRESAQQANLQNVNFVNVLGGTGAWIAEDKKVVVGADPV
ncbi:MAG: hypothetical protein RL691_1010 [Actinomycetota bacterium]